MKNFIVLILIIFAFFSCSHDSMLIKVKSTEQLEGGYGTEEGASQWLVLNSDSTFRYEYHLSSFPMSTTHGKWKIIGDGMIEFTSYDNNCYPISVSEKYYKELDSIEFKIKEFKIPSRFELIGYRLILDSIEVVEQKDPIIEIPLSKNEFSSFAINVIFEQDSLPQVDFIRYDIPTETYTRKSDSSNYFEITIPYEGTMYYGERIKSDTIIVKSDGLYWKRKGEYLFKKWID